MVFNGQKPDLTTQGSYPTTLSNSNGSLVPALTFEKCSGNRATWIQTFVKTSLFKVSVCENNLHAQVPRESVRFCREAHAFLKKRLKYN